MSGGDHIHSAYAYIRSCLTAPLAHLELALLPGADAGGSLPLATLGPAGSRSSAPPPPPLLAGSTRSTLNPGAPRRIRAAPASCTHEPTSWIPLTRRRRWIPLTRRRRYPVRPRDRATPPSRSLRERWGGGAWRGLEEALDGREAPRSVATEGEREAALDGGDARRRRESMGRREALAVLGLALFRRRATTASEN
nr:unnamed protein product [Digitaria exilis]